MNTNLKTQLTNGIEFGFRFYAFTLFCVYGVGKVVQFGGGEKFPTEMLNQDMTGQQVMWLFFGYSLSYPLFIGASQVVGGILLLFERTKLLGVLILLPIIINILLLDLIYHVNVGALMYAISLLFSLCFIMYWERKKVVEVLLVIIRQPKKWSISEKGIQIVIGVLFSILIFFAVRVLSNLPTLN